MKKVINSLAIVLLAASAPIYSVSASEASTDGTDNVQATSDQSTSATGSDADEQMENFGWGGGHGGGGFHPSPGPGPGMAAAALHPGPGLGPGHGGGASPRSWSWPRTRRRLAPGLSGTEPYPIHHGGYPWPHWDHPAFVRPIYYWDWNRLATVTCTAQDSEGELFPVTEDGYVGIGYQPVLPQMGDAAMDLATTRPVATPVASWSAVIPVTKTE